VVDGLWMVLSVVSVVYEADVDGIRRQGVARCTKSFKGEQLTYMLAEMMK
jgi:hypothetical protein